MNLIRIKPDKEKAKNLFELANLRIKKLNSFDIKLESTLLTESYYEIIKELITALLLAKGYKTLSHKDLIDFLKFNNYFSEHEIFVIDNLRKKRNKLVYEGVHTSFDYIQRNNIYFKNIIKKLKELVNSNTC